MRQALEFRNHPAGQSSVAVTSHAAGGTRGYRFVPFAIETYGRLGRTAVEVLGEWADAAAGSGAFDRDAYLTWVKRELSVT